MLEPGSDAAKAYALSYAKKEAQAADAEMRAIMNRAKIERLRDALRAIENHELRDYEDYEEIQEIATRALAQTK